MRLIEYIPGKTPFVLSIPHSGTHVPPKILKSFTVEGQALHDTDWHVEKLYDFSVKLGAHILFATHSRYVVDLNRDPEGKPLYPDADNTEICPLTDFSHRPIYRKGKEPSPKEVQSRVQQYWEPYHQKLKETLDAIKEKWGVCVLFDAHSIRSQVPRFFDGTLTDFNLGTASGSSASSELIHKVARIFHESEKHSFVLDGRFKGGYITRHHGNPDQNIHALQLELPQSLYMDENHPYSYRLKKAKKIRPVLRKALAQCIAWGQPKPKDPLPILLPS